MIDYDGLWVCAMNAVSHLLSPPTQPLSTPPYPTTCTKTSPITPSNTDTITNTTPGNTMDLLQMDCLRKPFFDHDDRHRHLAVRILLTTSK